MLTIWEKSDTQKDIIIIILTLQMSEKQFILLWQVLLMNKCKGTEHHVEGNHHQMGPV